MTNDVFEYDVALSYAGEDQAVADEFASLLAGRNISVFRDEYNAARRETWGKDAIDHLVNLYARKARYCVLLLSRHYPLTSWTESERISLKQRALRDAGEYILPLRLDDTDIPGVTEAAGYRDLRQHPVASIVDLLEEKLARAGDQPGPPARSHDLRSGNVPKG